jgi:hypothetical protein
VLELVPWLPAKLREMMTLDTALVDCLGCVSCVKVSSLVIIIVCFYVF